MKFVVVGTGTVGKTCLAMTATGEEFPDEYIPSCTDGLTQKICVSGVNYEVTLRDTSGPLPDNQLRSLNYPNSDAVLLCFSCVHSVSFHDIASHWIEEIRHFAPDAVVVLVATKIDLRQDKDAIRRLKDNKMEPLTSSDGLKLAAQIDADAYCETSSMVGFGIKNLLFHVASLVLSKKKHQKPKGFLSKLISASKKKKSDFELKPPLPSKHNTSTISSFGSKKCVSPEVSFQDLPKDIWLNIFSFLSWKDLLVCDAVCKSFSSLSRSDRLWERFCLSQLFHGERESFKEEQKQKGKEKVEEGRLKNIFKLKLHRYQMYLWMAKNPWAKEYKNSELFWVFHEYLQ
eukprot:TRINITY_DN8343_c0_g1_i1.p1 TRINITY_DN8343_c0_g1~~TRINITY_DN8343_c0_g1_i1.p1  ORF type:complete len:344 (-),score=74.76 TRINITY_DN8343_c0_g1_i1:11-1042(-)